jgi:hypothetical protein
METIVPYKEEFKKYIPEQYKNSEKLLALVNSCMAQFDDLETAFFEILQSLNLADAIGPALDYLGAIVGVKRNPGESDTQYRERIVSGLNLLNLPGPEALRMVIKFLTGVDSVGLFPNWPAEMYYVLDGGTDANLSNLEKNSMTSGASLVRGTFLCAEEGEGGYIVNDDNGMPFVVDYIEGADAPINVIRFTFSDQSYNPVTAGVGQHGTWTKVEGTQRNEWDWHCTSPLSGTYPGEFEDTFMVDSENPENTNWVSVRCNGYTEELNCYRMFRYCTAITSVFMTGMSGVTDAYYMFGYCTNMKSIVFNGAENMNNVGYFCDSCANLETATIDTIGKLDTEDSYNNGNLYYTFAYCPKLKTVSLGDLAAVKKTEYTFFKDYELESIYLDLPNAERMYSTFMNCTSLKSVVLKNTNKVTYFSNTFSECTSMIDGPEMDTSGAINMYSVFKDCTSLKVIPEYDVSSVRNADRMFFGCKSLEYVPVLKFSEEINLYQFFQGCTSLKEIPKWDYPKNMSQTFYGCTSLKEIPEWFTPAVGCKDVDYIFIGCVNIERGIKSCYDRIAALNPTGHNYSFKNCGINTIGGIGDLTKIPTSWGGLGAIPANSLLFNFGDPDYNPNETTTSNHGTWTSYSTGYADNTFNLWLWTYGGDEDGWASEFMPDISHSYLSDFENNPVDVVAHGDLTDIKCYLDLFCRASALRYCCDFVIPDASAYHEYDISLQGMFSRCDNLEVFPHIDVTNLRGGINYIADNCTKLTTITPPTIRSTVGNDMDALNAFRGCRNVERGAAETYAVLNNIAQYATSCFSDCGVNKLTGVSDLLKIPSMWGGLGLVSENAIVFAFGDENYNPSTASVGAGGTWTELANNPTDFNIWTWTNSGNNWSGEFENAFTDEVNKPYILAIGSTVSITNVDNFLKESTYVRHGALDMYRQMSGQSTPPSNHEKTFHDCGKLTEQGLFELLQIPVNWGGDVLTFCIENNLVAYLPDENQTEVLVQSIRYYQDVFRMMKNSDL